MDDEVQGPRRRRTHSPAFKAHVLQACSQPGVSIAAVALSNGLNANLVRRVRPGRMVDTLSGRMLDTRLCVQVNAANVRVG